MDNDGRIPVIILTGFLGSGKTTLLNALLRDPAWSDSAVIVNEFGDIGLDHLLVSESKDGVILMDAGCLCCAVLDSLPETLSDLYRRRASATVPPFRHVLVETSGLAEPAPIMRTLMRDPLASHFYRPQGLVCAVDAVFGQETLAREHGAVAQVRIADRIILTKTDLVGGEAPPDLLAQLRALNPVAPVVRASASPCAALFVPADADAPWLGGFEEVAHHHHGSIGSASFVIEQPVSWAALAAWIDAIRDRYGRDLLRVKGLMNVDGRPVVLHGVQTAFDTLRRADWPDDERRSRLVVIGHGVQREELRQTLQILNPGTVP